MIFLWRASTANTRFICYFRNLTVLCKMLYFILLLQEHYIFTIDAKGNLTYEHTICYMHSKNPI